MSQNTPTLRQVLEFPELAKLDPRSPEERAVAFEQDEPDFDRPAGELLKVEIEAAVCAFAPVEEPWAKELELATFAAAARHGARSRQGSVGSSGVDTRLDRLVEKAAVLVRGDGNGEPDLPVVGEGPGVQEWDRNDNGGSGDGNTLLFRSATSVVPRNFEFLENDGRIPMGAMTIVAGVGGLGKSTYTTTLSSRVSKDRAVLIVSSEDHWGATIKPRLMAAGANMDNVFFPVDQEGEAVVFRFPDDLGQLDAYVSHFDGLAVVILDPMSAMVNTRDINNNDDANVRSFLDPLGRIARKNDCAMVCVMHFNKRENASVFLRLAASGGYYNSVRSVLVWAQQDELSNERYLAHAKCNVGPKQATEHYRIDVVEIEGGLRNTKATRIGVAHMTAEQLVNPPQDDRTGEKTAEAEQILEELWREAGRAIPATDAITKGDSMGISERTMRRALDRLGGEPRKTGYRKGWEWVPPEGIFTVSQETLASSGPEAPETP